MALVSKMGLQALDFAESELAPLTDLHPDFLEELEETMALFAFEDQHASPLAHLLEPAQRHKVYIPTLTPPCILMPPDTRLGQSALPVFGACTLGRPIRACNLRPSPQISPAGGERAQRRDPGVAVRAHGTAAAEPGTASDSSV